MRCSFFLPLTFAISLCACTLKAPENDLGYARFESLVALNGCYENRSEVQSGPSPALLTSEIWPNVNFGKTQVDSVQVLSVGNNALRVAAIAAHKIIRDDTFVRDKDFTFESGIITIAGSSDTFGSTASTPGEVFIGMGASTKTLGVDAMGQGRLKSSVTFAGTVFLIFPVGGKVNEIDRFRKNDELCTVK